jgi:hypothetical protein
MTQVILMELGTKEEYQIKNPKIEQYKGFMIGYI